MIHLIMYTAKKRPGQALGPWPKLKASGPVVAAWCFISRPGTSRRREKRNPSNSVGGAFLVSALYSGLKVFVIGDWLRSVVG